LEHLNQPVETGFSDHSVNFSTVAKKHETGQRLNAQLAGQVGIVVDIDFAHGIPGIDHSLHDWLHDSAMSAPIGRETQQDRIAVSCQRKSKQASVK
jgi:hypothetical protein